MNWGDPKNVDQVTGIFTETNLPCCWMWNMRSPPFRYSITKNRCDWNRKLKNIIPHVKAGVIIGYEKKLLLTSVWKVQKR